MGETRNQKPKPEGFQIRNLDVEKWTSVKSLRLKGLIMLMLTTCATGSGEEGKVRKKQRQATILMEEGQFHRSLVELLLMLRKKTVMLRQ